MGCNNLVNKKGQVVGHICMAEPFKNYEPTHKKFKKVKAKEKVLTDCCVRRIEARHTVTGESFQEWYGWDFHTICPPDKGCSVSPKMKCGADGRRLFAGF